MIIGCAGQVVRYIWILRVIKIINIVGGPGDPRIYLEQLPCNIHIYWAGGWWRGRWQAGPIIHKVMLAGWGGLVGYQLIQTYNSGH